MVQTSDPEAGAPGRRVASQKGCPCRPRVSRHPTAAPAGRQSARMSRSYRRSGERRARCRRPSRGTRGGCSAHRAQPVDLGAGDDPARLSSGSQRSPAASCRARARPDPGRARPCPSARTPHPRSDSESSHGTPERRSDSSESYSRCLTFGDHAIPGGVECLGPIHIRAVSRTCVIAPVATETRCSSEVGGRYSGSFPRE